MSIQELEQIEDRARRGRPIDSKILLRLPAYLRDVYRQNYLFAGRDSAVQGLSHNLILGAAGGALLATEAAIVRGLVYRRI